MIIVCDSSPLFALAICAKLELLDKLYDKVLLPTAVYHESTIMGKQYAEQIKGWTQGKVVAITNDDLF